MVQKDNKIYFFDDEQPQSASRPRFWQGKARIAPKYLAYRNHLTNSFTKQIENMNEKQKQYLKEIIINPYGIKVRIIYYFYYSKVNSNIHAYNIRRPDLDNLMKATIDSLFGTRFFYNLKTDDSHIVSINLEKINVTKPENCGLILSLESIS